MSETIILIECPKCKRRKQTFLCYIKNNKEKIICHKCKIKIREKDIIRRLK